MSSFTLKMIAIICMLIDHSCDVFVQHYSIGYVIGRIAFPLFAFQIVVGYENTRDIKKYLERILIFALISEIPYAIMIYNYIGTLDMNVFFDLFFALFSLVVWNSKQIHTKSNILNWTIKLLLIALMCFLSEILHFDHGTGGILTVLLIYIFYPFELNSKRREKKYINYNKIEKNKENNLEENNNGINIRNIKMNQTLRIVLFALVMAILSLSRFISFIPIIGINDYILVVMFTYLPTIFMLAYNGKKGPSLKYLFYAFYPIHITILNILYYICFK